MSKINNSPLPVGFTDFYQWMGWMHMNNKNCDVYYNPWEFEDMGEDEVLIDDY